MDVGFIDFALPAAEFHLYLRRLVQAGFGERIMFGSDQVVWPQAIERAIQAVESAPFLSPKQKRDIFYNNAARFFPARQGRDRPSPWVPNSVLPSVAAINAAAAPGVSVLTLSELEDLWHRATVFWVAGDANEAAAYLIGFAGTAEYDGEEFGWFRAREAGFLHIDQAAVAVYARRAGLGRALYATRRARRRSGRSPG